MADVMIDLGRPPPDSRRPPRTRRPAAVLAGVLAVAAVAVVGFVWADRPRITGAVALLPHRVYTLTGGAPLGVTFVDVNHGFGITARCGVRTKQECEARLSVTSDGGASWTKAALPAEVDPAHGGQLVPLDPDRLVFDQPDAFTDAREIGTASGADPQGLRQFDARGLPGYLPARRWFSADRGRTWREVAPRPAGTIAEVPPGGVLFYPTPPVAYATVQAEPVVTSGVSMARAELRSEVMLADGSSRTLVNAPPGENGFQAARVVDTGASGIWVIGHARRTDSAPSGDLSFLEFTVRASADRGRTWRTVPLPAGRGRTDVLTADGRHVYLLDSEPNGATVSYSLDGGGTWASTSTATIVDPATGVAPARGYAASAAVLPDGTLLMVVGGRFERLEASRNSISRVNVDADGVVVAQAGRLVVVTRRDSTRLVTADALTWSRLDT